MNKILLGQSPVINNSRSLYISKHSWDCDWYWSFGYIGNSHLHTHVDSVFLKTSKHEWTNVNFWFARTFLTQNNWWEFLERFQTAYNLRAAADTIYRGGAHISKACMQSDKQLAKEINGRLENHLDTTWLWLQNLSQTQEPIAYDHPLRNLHAR